MEADCHGAEEGGGVTPTWETVVERTRPYTDKDGTTSFPVDRTERLRVPGGWIYRTVQNPFCIGVEDQDRVSMVFVPRRWWMR